MTEQKAKRVVWIFTAVVYVAVLSLHYLPAIAEPPSFTKYQPLLNAVINGTCFILLIVSFMAIRNKKVEIHRRLNTTAMVLSAFFLINYVVYHALSGDTQYGGTMKGLYYFVLITHIVLAGISLPMILMAWIRGFFGNIEGHRKLVRFTYPIWLYVTLTGVLVYAFLAPYYS